MITVKVIVYRGWTFEEKNGEFFAKCEGAVYGPYPSIRKAKDAIYVPIIKEAKEAWDFLQKLKKAGLSDEEIGIRGEVNGWEERVQYPDITPGEGDGGGDWFEADAETVIRVAKYHQS